jgi:hypothetical protein
VRVNIIKRNENDENVPPKEEQREYSTTQGLFVALLKNKKVIFTVISAQ